MPFTFEKLFVYQKIGRLRRSRLRAHQHVSARQRISYRSAQASGPVDRDQPDRRKRPLHTSRSPQLLWHRARLRPGVRAPSRSLAAPPTAERWRSTDRVKTGARGIVQCPKFVVRRFAYRHHENLPFSGCCFLNHDALNLTAVSLDDTIWEAVWDPHMNAYLKPS